MNIIKFQAGDRVLMKKKHPCSADTFRIARIGSDIRIICEGCGRDLTVSREALEKMVKKVLSSQES